MSAQDTVPMVRCRLDARDPEDPVRELRYVPLDEFGLWKYLMEHKHSRQVMVEEISIWVAEESAPRWNSFEGPDNLEPVLRVRFQQVAADGTPVPVQRFFPAETYPEAQEALLRHYRDTPAQFVRATPGYFVPMRSSEREPAVPA
jgi:hypothetical protein